MNAYKRLSKALKEEFYLEAIAIGYAVIEDRLVSFLHHAGIVSRNNDDLKVNRAVYPYIRSLLKKDDKYKIRIKDISVKVNVICKLLTLTEDDARSIDVSVGELKRTGKRKSRILESGYMLDLFKQIDLTIERELIIDIFYNLEPWRKERNQLIHALLNKTVSSSEKAKKSCAETGRCISREIDNCLVKPFKVGNKLRKKYRIQ